MYISFDFVIRFVTYALPLGNHRAGQPLLLHWSRPMEELSQKKAEEKILEFAR
jgi:hypothetical protein